MGLRIVHGKPVTAALHRKGPAVDERVHGFGRRCIEAQTKTVLERERPEPAGVGERHDDAATSERSKMRVNSAYRSRIRSGRAWAW